MSSWNEETKTLHNSDGRLIRIVGTSLHAKDLMVPGLEVKVPGLAPADLAAFGHAVLEAAGAPVAAPEPVFPRTVPASEVHEHVGSRVTVEGDGYTITGSLKKAAHLAVSDRCLLFVTIPALDRETTLNIPANHPIILEAPADAGASVVGGA